MTKVQNTYGMLMYPLYFLLGHYIQNYKTYTLCTYDTILLFFCLLVSYMFNDFMENMPLSVLACKKEKGNCLI